VFHDTGGNGVLAEGDMIRFLVQGGVYHVVIIRVGYKYLSVLQ
jgi:hypothetical protein